MHIKITFDKSSSFLAEVGDYSKFCVTETVFLQEHVYPTLAIVFSQLESDNEVQFSLIEQKVSVSVEPFDPGTYLVTIPVSLHKKVAIADLANGIQELIERQIA